MEIENVVGYRFIPTDQESVNYYLKNKILGKSWLVDEAINEINICDFEPEFLPSLSKIKSDDPLWYFFSLLSMKKNGKKMVTKRTTPFGYWKPTGVDRKIKDKRGNGVEIGIKKTLVHYKGKSAEGVRTSWVMHEYHITSLPLVVQRPYVICKVMYNGDDGDSSYGNKSNELSHSMVIDSMTTAASEFEQLDQEDNNLFYEDDLLRNEEEDLSLFNTDTFFNDNNSPYLHPQIPWDEEFIRGMLNFNGGNFDNVCPNTEIRTQENRSNHRPKKPLTGIIANSSSDSEAESISAMSYGGTTSPGGSSGSSSGHFNTSVDKILLLKKDSCKHIRSPAETFINRKTGESTIPSKEEVKEGKSKAFDASMEKNSSSSMVKTEKKGWFITEEAMQRNRKNPPYIYLMNMIIGFIILVAVIGNIKSVLLSFKT